MINIINYGFTEDFNNQITQEDLSNGLIPARVTSIQKESYDLVSSNGHSHGKLKSSIFYHNAKYIQYPAVGDFVLIKSNQQGPDIIYKVLDRKSKFSRENTAHSNLIASHAEQIVATNFDYVFIMASLNHDFNIKRLQRYIAISRSSGGIPVIILTKSDLCEEIPLYTSLIESNFPSIEYCVISTHDAYGMDTLSKYMQAETTIALLGSSGVGKSSLVNYLVGYDFMKVNDIREDDSKGKHTTTHRQMVFLDNHVMLIDTPGMRELSLWDADEGLSETFVDMESLIEQCKFSNCTHRNEPGCAVKQALISGDISESDIDSYNKLKKDIRRNTRRAKIIETRSNKEQNYKAKKKKDSIVMNSFTQYDLDELY